MPGGHEPPGWPAIIPELAPLTNVWRRVGSVADCVGAAIGSDIQIGTVELARRQAAFARSTLQKTEIQA